MTDDTVCTKCGHNLSEHEPDYVEDRRYRKWCRSGVGALECECNGFRDENWEPPDSLGDER